MINRRTFFKLAAAVGSVVARLIPWPKAEAGFEPDMLITVGQGSKVVLDNFGLRCAVFQGAIEVPKELSDDWVLQDSLLLTVR